MLSEWTYIFPLAPGRASAKMIMPVASLYRGPACLKPHLVLSQLTVNLSDCAVLGEARKQVVFLERTNHQRWLGEDSQWRLGASAAAGDVCL